MDSLNFRIDPGKCVRCDACVRDCPWGIISREGDLPAIPEPPEGGCLACQHCLAVCPTGAVSIFGLKPEDSLSLTDGSVPTRQQMRALVRGRRSVRQFRDEDVPSAVIDELLADLAHAPTGCNDRDLTFAVVPGRAGMRALRERVTAALEARQKAGDPVLEFLVDAAAAYRRDGTDEFFRGAPHLLVVSPGEKATCGQEDAVLALAYFELLAHSAGLGATWCGMLKFAVDAAPELRKPLGLAAGGYFYAMMFGRPDVRYARTVQRDTVARIRRIPVE